MSNVKTCLFVVALLLPAAAWSQASRGPLPSLGPPTSDLDRANRLKDTDLRDIEALATLEILYRSSGDLMTRMVKKNPQNLFVTVELDGAQLKNISRNKKPKVQEAVSSGLLSAKGRWSRPGKRLEATCEKQLEVGFQQIVFLPYGGEKGFFSCEVLPRLLADERFDAWKGALVDDQAQAYHQCAGVHPRGSGNFWSCIETAGITFPEG